MAATFRQILLERLTETPSSTREELLRSVFERFDHTLRALMSEGLVEFEADQHGESHMDLFRLAPGH